MEQSDLALIHTEGDRAFQAPFGSVEPPRRFLILRSGEREPFARICRAAVHLAPRIYLSSRSVLSFGSLLDPVSRPV